MYLVVIMLIDKSLQKDNYLKFLQDYWKAKRLEHLMNPYLKRSSIFFHLIVVVFFFSTSFFTTFFFPQNEMEKTIFNQMCKLQKTISPKGSTKQGMMDSDETKLHELTQVCYLQ